MNLGFYKSLCLKPNRKVDFDKGTVQGIFEEIDNVLYIMFRATDEQLDWWNHLLFFPAGIPYNNEDSKVKIHMGWLSEYKRVQIRTFIHNKVNSFKGNKVVCVGSSYGAALATICAVDIQYNFFDKEVCCVALSSPKVGNKAFTSSFNKRVPKSLMAFNGNDIVVEMPPAIFGFDHIANVVHFGKRKFWRTVTNTVSVLWTWMVTKKINDIQDLDLFGDHDIFKNNVMPDEYEVGF
jgi:triacylglycerol lipase